MKLSHLAHVVPFTQLHSLGDPEITQVDYDSRRVVPGSLFVAIKGEKFDGHKYVSDALNKGAAAVAVNNVLPEIEGKNYFIVTDSREALAYFAGAVAGHPDRDLNLVVVTGTNGKTTTVNLVAEVFRKVWGNSGVIGTLGGRIGDKEIAQERTTPEAPDIYGLLNQMKAEGIRGAAMEASSHAIELKRVLSIHFDVAAFTNLSQDHLDFHGDIETYFQAKAKLFNAYDIAKAVINVDDEYGQRLLQMSSAPILTYGFDERADVVCSSMSLDRSGSTVKAKTPRGELYFTSTLIGKFNVYNFLCVLAVVEAFELPHDDFIKAVSEFSGLPGRMECIDLGNRWAYIDYSHTPQALEVSIKELKRLIPGEVHVIFGCGGNRDREKRPRMGNIAESEADKVYITNDNPRDEDPEEIIEAILSGMHRRSQVEVITDRREAIRVSLDALPEGGALLIAGKGHETYQEIRGIKQPFSDKEEVLKYVDRS